MKKALVLVLVVSLALGLCACASDSGEINGPDNNAVSASPTPVPTVNLTDEQLHEHYVAEDELSLENLMTEFSERLQPGTAGSSLKAVAQAAKLMDWGVSTVMLDEEIFAVVSVFFSHMDDDEIALYLTQLQLLDSTYQQLLQPGQESLLETAGCADAAYPWSSGPIPAVESFMLAAGVRESYQLAYDPAAVEDAFTPLIRDYYRAFSEGWNEPRINEKGLNFILIMESTPYDPLNALGFARHDINGDGVDELIIGNTADDRTVYSIYAQKDGQVFSVFDGWFRNVGFICADGTVVVQGSGGAAITYRSYYSFDGSALKVFGSVIHEGNASPNSPWFISSDDDKDIMNDSPASEAQALGLIQQYESQYLSFELAPLAKAGEL